MQRQERGCRPSKPSLSGFRGVAQDPIGVEVRQWFVEQQQPRRGASARASSTRVRSPVESRSTGRFAKGASSSKSINASTCPGSGLGSPSAMTSGGRDGPHQLARRRQEREDVGSSAWRQLVYALIGDAHLPGGRINSGERPQQARLSAAVRTDQRDELSRIERKVGRVRADARSRALEHREAAS